MQQTLQIQGGVGSSPGSPQAQVGGWLQPSTVHLGAARELNPSVIHSML
jgi:hypothetical protein